MTGRHVGILCLLGFDVALHAQYNTPFIQQDCCIVLAPPDLQNTRLKYHHTQGTCREATLLLPSFSANFETAEKTRSGYVALAA